MARIKDSDRRAFVQSHKLSGRYYPERLVGRGEVRCSCGESAMLAYGDPSEAAEWWGMHLLARAGFDTDAATVRRDMLALLKEVRKVANKLEDYTEGEELKALVVKYI